MSKITIGLRDFHKSGRLNLESFTNLNSDHLEKSDFDNLYPASQNFILTEAAFQRLQKDVIQKSIESTGLNGIENAEKSLGDFSEIMVLNEFFEPVKMYVKPKLQKGHVANALMLGEGLALNKTGIEIKEHLEGICAKIKQKITAIQARCMILLEKVDCLPAEELPEWEYKGCEDKINTKYIFSWEKCFYNNNSTFSNEVVLTGEKAQSEEEATNCRNYNECVKKLLKCEVDCCYIEAMKQNLEDGKSYELSPEQVVALGF